MKKAANKTNTVKLADKTADNASTKLAGKASTKSINPSIKSTEKSIKSVKSIKSTTTGKSDDKSSNYAENAEEIVPEHNPNCPCLGDCNCIRLRTSESVSDEDDPGVCLDFVPQHLVIDFTPTEDLETAASVETCLKLWEMLEKVPHWAKAIASEASSPAVELSPRSEPEEPPPPSEQPHDHMAVSILNLMDQAGMTVPVFEAREKSPYCIDEKQDYFKVPEQVSCPHLPTRVSVKYNADGRPSIERKKPKPKKPVDVKNMVTELDSWDNCHPKSMAPPGHPPETSSMVQHRRKKSFGPCHRECKECAKYDCRTCGCHAIENRLKD